MTPKQACRARFEDVPVGAPVWHLHHEHLLEWLTEPAANRIAYILSYIASEYDRLHEYAAPVEPESET